MSEPIPIQLAQRPIDGKVADALFGVMPENWHGIQLEARRVVLGPASESYALTLASTQGKAGVAHASEALQDAVRELFLLHKKYRTCVSLARYILEEGPKGWGLVSEFDYDDALPD